MPQVARVFEDKPRFELKNVNEDQGLEKERDAF